MTIGRKAKSKKPSAKKPRGPKRVIVDAKYLEVIRAKAAMIDEMSTGDGFLVASSYIKEYDKLDTEWCKLDPSSDATEPYRGPKPRVIRERDVGQTIMEVDVDYDPDFGRIQ